MNGKMVRAMILVSVLMLVLPAYAQVPIPRGISGIVYLSDGVTEAPWGTSFSLNDITSGDYMEGTTGAGPHSGWYSVSINGSDGDEVTVKAWNTTHLGITSVTLLGDMAGIDVVIDIPAPTLTPAPAYAKGGDAHPKVTPTATSVATRTPITTHKPEATPILSPTATPTPTSTPTTTSKPEQKIPGFDALFAIIGLLAVTYILKSCEGGK